MFNLFHIRNLAVVDENELTIDSYLAIQQLLKVNSSIAHIDRPTFDIASSKVGFIVPFFLSCTFSMCLHLVPRSYDCALQ